MRMGNQQKCPLRVGAAVHLVRAWLRVQTIVGLRWISPTKLRRWGVKTLALGISLLMAAPGMAAPAASAGNQPSAAEIIEPLRKSHQELGAALAGSKPDAQASPKEIADRLEKLFQALEAAEREIPRDTFDVQAVVEKVGRDPVKLFEWVRDNTFLVPYRGLLRGEKGVLMDRLGNSLDRAMLLQALLRSAGHEVQLAHGSLSKERAKEVMEKARPIPEGGVPTLQTSRQMPDNLLQRVAQQNQLDQEELRKRIEKVNLAQQRVAEQVAQRVAEQARAIAAAVGKLKEEVIQAVESARLDSLRDHWWVQWKKESNWVDLDPTLLDAEPGRTLTNVRETITPDKLAGTLYHEVRIRIIVERWEEERLKEVPVLTHTLRPSELFGKRIAIRHIPLKWPKDLNLFEEKDPLQRLKTTVLAQDEWVPVLTVGSTNVIQSSFTDSGDTNDKPLAPILGGAPQQLGKRTGGMLRGGGIGQVPGRKPEKKAHLTAEWIEYEIRSPGHPVQKIRREIFDLVGPATRAAGGSVPAPEMTEAQRLERGLTLLGETEILTMVSQLSSEFVEHLIAKNMLANREILPGMLRNVALADAKALNEQLGKFKPLPTQLYNLALARRGWSRFRSDTYVDRPNIFSFNRLPRMDQKGQLVLRADFDIVANDIAVREGSDIDTFSVRLEQGVLDTNAEAVIASSCMGIASTEIRCDHVRNTAEIFASTQNVSWRTIRERSDPSWRSLGVSENDQVRIGTDLNRGFVVMLPERAVVLDHKSVMGWWIINPKTGHTLGLGDRGGGSAAVEYWGMEAKVWAVLIGSVTTLILLAGCGSQATSTCQNALCALKFVVAMLTAGIGTAASEGVEYLTIVGAGIASAASLGGAFYKCP